MKENIFLSFYRRKKCLSHDKIVQQHFDTNILSREYPTKLKIYGNSRGWGYDKLPPRNGNSRGMGGLKQKCPPWGDMDVFWNYTICLKGPLEKWGF